MMKALFSLKEIVSCSVLGAHTNKRVAQRPGLDPVRRDILESKFSFKSSL